MSTRPFAYECMLLNVEIEQCTRQIVCLSVKRRILETCILSFRRLQPKSVRQRSADSLDSFSRSGRERLMDPIRPKKLIGVGILTGERMHNARKLIFQITSNGYFEK